MNTTSLAHCFSPDLLPSSTRDALQRGDPATLAALGRELRPYLDTVPDPRRRAGRRYELPLLLILCLVGFCTGCLGYLSVARWVRALPPAALQAFGWTRPSTPCAATWLHLFRVLDWDGVATVFQAWASAAGPHSEPGPATVTSGTAPEPQWEGFAIDGKALRGSLAAGADLAHVVSIVGHGTGVSLRDVGVGQKQGELTVAPGLLASVLGPGRVFTGDALFTQRNLCQQLCAGDSHYVLIVKGNQPTLLAQVQTALGAVTAREAREQQRRSTAQANTGHGRHEHRFLLLAAVTSGQVDWPGTTQVFCLERRRIQPARAGKPTHHSRELVYGITSLPVETAGPETVLRLQRGHWGIEVRHEVAGGIVMH